MDDRMPRRPKRNPYSRDYRTRCSVCGVTSPYSVCLGCQMDDVVLPFLDRSAMEEMDKPAGDEHMGDWVYCSQHRRPHRTGWCTVAPRDKLGLHVESEEEAYQKVRHLGLSIYGEKKITVEDLNNIEPCEQTEPFRKYLRDQVAIFREHFPDGLEATVANAQKAIDCGLDVAGWIDKVPCPWLTGVLVYQGGRTERYYQGSARYNRCLAQNPTDCRCRCRLRHGHHGKHRSYGTSWDR